MFPHYEGAKKLLRERNSDRREKQQLMLPQKTEMCVFSMYRKHIVL